jgi:hypothetical protein
MRTKKDKCPTCGTEFIQSMHPFDVEVRERYKNVDLTLLRKAGN